MTVLDTPLSQTDSIKKHLRTMGTITSWEAIQTYGATRLSAIIYNLRNNGWDIDSTDEPNSNGKGIHTLYTLITAP